MNEEPVTSQTSTSATGSGCLGDLGWLSSGFIMPLGSITFYRKAAQKSVGGAILFFFLFTLTIAFIASVGIGRAFLSMGDDIRTSFEDGTIPEIVIRNGVAEVNGAQPVILIDTYANGGSRTFVAIDTTDVIKQVDRNRYDQGFLLKKKELHVLNNNGRYQVLPLSQLHTIFNTDSIVINAETSAKGWNTFSIIMTVVVFIALVIWNSIVRLMYISMIALILWGIVSLIRPNTDFGPVIISGIYALVPVIYIDHLLDRVGLSFLTLQTILLMPIWLIALFISLAPIDFFARERPQRLWRALIGLPILIVMAVDVILTFEYGDVASWVVMFLTVIAFAVIGILPRIKENQLIPPEPPAPSV